MFFTFYQKEFHTNHKVQVVPKNTSYISIKINRKCLQFLLWWILSVPLANAVPCYVSWCVNRGLSKWCGTEKNKIHEGPTQHWPVHINHTLCSVQPYVHVFRMLHFKQHVVSCWEISCKSPGFTKWWPRCLNPNAAKASQSQKTHAIYQAQFMQHPFIWVSC
jgi:hypothetical protein